MIDFHTHSVLSDGELLPEELIRRAAAVGYRVLVIADHVGFSNAELVIPALVSAARKANELSAVQVIPGAEVTHCPPEQFGELTDLARQLGARWVVGHGETLVEPVAPGTNRAAIEARVDVLAHPGPIREQDARLAAEKGVFLELSSRRGHSLTNGHVALTAHRTGAELVFGSDAHAPGDLCAREFADSVLRGAGLTEEDIAGVWARMDSAVKGRLL